MTDKQINSMVVINHNGTVHSLTMVREEGELANITTAGDIKMLEHRWELIKLHIDLYFEEYEHD